MDHRPFLEQGLALDLEIGADGTLLAVGALYGQQELARSGRLDRRAVLAELADFGRDAVYLLGHNLLGHDLPYLQAAAPELALLGKPVVDTLYLSPLAFPENPYHRLVKDYKLVRDSLNDPLADARLATRLLAEQWHAFAELANTAPAVPALYRYCLEHSANGGFAAFFRALGIAALDSAAAFRAFVDQTQSKVCRTALSPVALRCLPDPEQRLALAYALAWLRVAGSNSVLPPWVRGRFPAVSPLLRQLRDTVCTDPACRYCRTTHDPTVQLTHYFGFTGFRGALQEQIVTAALSEQPLLAILPTGGGKSLCYQLPALVRHQRRGGLTVVISPLQALMKDQVDNLSQRTGTPNAAALSGLLTPPERGEVLERVRLGDIALLYVSPEQLRNRSFRTTIAQREVDCWVFDEAHCLSKWGHDFRPDYLYAARFINTLARQQGVPAPPVQCFTATAKQEVKNEICSVFQRELGQELRLFAGGVERDNLHFEVYCVNSAEKYPRLQSLLSARLHSGSAIVYCSTRQRTEAAATFLSNHQHPAEAFHAGLDAPRKRAIQERFISGETRVICATNAFGMGIDKEDVRLVIHADIPGSLENYLQEAGRAGRDRQEAVCILLYDEQDVEAQFGLSARAELGQRDIQAILRGLRQARRDRDGQIVITSGELLRQEAVSTRIDPDDRAADTNVKMAVAWLERAGFVERNDNQTRVFQGRPLVKNLDEARTRIAALNLSPTQQQRWLALLTALLNADPDQGLSADELTEIAAFRPDDHDNATPATLRVLRTLHDMAAQGLIRQGLLLSAYVRHKIKDHSLQRLERVCALEQALLTLLREEAPDAEQGEWQTLALRRLNQRLLDAGHASSPEALRLLLHSLAADGRGLAGAGGSLDYRYAGLDTYRIRLRRDWALLGKTASKRQALATVTLHAILARLAADTPPGADLLVEFALDDVLTALQQDVTLAGRLKDPLAAVDRALLFLHEQRVIVLQQGLAVFRQALTVKLLPEAKNRRYSKGDYEALDRHYGERRLQIHVMGEYAALALNAVSQALKLVLDYFDLDKKDFIKRYFANRKELLDYATSQASFQRIVDSLANPVQTAVVAAPVESNLLILAGPGAGKTRVVVHRCAYLLRVRRQPPASILILCFNRHAARTLRRRLSELVGTDAAGVTIQTYHGLALRLTGHSLAARLDTAGTESVDFDQIISEASALLRGEHDLPGIEQDELRERLLAGYRTILVDEYQDIDARQYDFISAIAGRTQADPDHTLAILAVGDDDQNIYAFRETDVAFIRRFQVDYQATVHYLLDNYRSSAAIISAANALIRHNRERMKADQPIRINQARRNDPPGAPVLILHVTDPAAQAAALVAELHRLRAAGGSVWSDYAVLARHWDTLAAVRAACETHQFPTVLVRERDKLPSPHRVREVAAFLAALKALGEQPVMVTELLALIAPGEHVWTALLRQTLAEWGELAGDHRTPARQVLEFVYETLHEARRDGQPGEGVLLATAHAAKGLEFRHVFILDGGWNDGGEEERRLYYVAMTRAQETLCLLELPGGNPHTRLLHGDVVQHQTAAAPPLPPALVLRRYELLGLRELFIDFAGQHAPHEPLHARLAALTVGSVLSLRAEDERMLLCDSAGVAVARLARTAAEVWRSRLALIVTVRVLALVQWRREDSSIEFRDRCRCEHWEIPVVEIVYTAKS